MNKSDFELAPGNSPARWTRRDIAFLLFTSVFIYLQLFIIPATPVYVESDQLIPVSNAMRILDGQVIYRDFFHLAPPGADYYYAALFSIFGARIWLMNATVLLLAIAQLLLLFAFSKRLLSGVYVYLPTLFYFVVVFRQYGIDGSYRLFSIVFVFFAAFIVFEKRTPTRLMFAGSMCGLASFFVQTRGVLGVGAIGLFLLWLHYRQGIKFATLLRDWFFIGGAFALLFVATQFYPAYAAGFNNYYFCTVTFLKDYYGSDTLSNTRAYFTDLPSLSAYFQTYGTSGGWFRYVRVAGPTLFIYALVPLLYLVYFLYRWIRPTKINVDRHLMLLSILGCVLYLGVSAPTAFRLYHISIPAVILLAWFLENTVRVKNVGRGITCALLLLATLYSFQRQLIANATPDLPGGRTAFLATNLADKYEWLATVTSPGDEIFEAQHPTYYFPMHLKNPTPFYMVRDNNYTPPFQVDQLMRALRSNRPRFIAWQGSWSKEPSERIPGDNLAPLWEFIRTNYDLKKEFREYGEFTTNSDRDIEFWELKN